MCRVTCPGCSSDPGFDLPALPMKFGNETNLALKAPAEFSLGELLDAWFDGSDGGHPQNNGAMFDVKSTAQLVHPVDKKVNKKKIRAGMRHLC